MSNLNEKKLGVGKLTMFAIGTTLGSGVFSLSGDFAAGGAYTFATLIGWLICGVGMLGLAMCFFRLSVVKPALTSGIYTYAREGFGEYMGFNSAWGYWISAILAQMSYVTLFFATLTHFFPVFGNGSNFVSMATATVIIWLLSWLVLRGVNQAVGINAVVVSAKIAPIIVTVVAIALARSFRWSIFMHNFYGVEGGLSILDQIKSTIFITVWIFIGIEGAVVLSGRGKNTRVAGQATMISYLSLLALYFIISFLSMGVMTTEELAGLSNPPLAGVLEHVVGRWGAVLVNIAVLISVGGSMFTYTILCVDSAFGPAEHDAFPASLKKLNRFKAPVWSVIVSAIVIQIFIIVIYFNAGTYQAVYAMSTSTIMVPYVFTSFYYLKVVIRKEGLEAQSKNRASSWIIAIIGSLYGIWMLYASGLMYVLISVMLYAPGTIMYLYHRKKQGKKYFETKLDFILCICIMIALIAAIVLTVSGKINPF